MIMIKPKYIFFRLYILLNIVLIILLSCPRQAIAQLTTIDSTSRYKIFLSQGTDVSLVGFTNKYLYRLNGNNLQGGNLDFSFGMNFLRKNGEEIVLNFKYSNDKDMYTYANYYLDDYGESLIKIDAHLIAIEFGIKFFSKKYLIDLNLYTVISSSIRFSLYRNNEFDIPGFYHYQLFDGFQYSNINFLIGKGLEIPVYNKQFSIVEVGLDLPLVVYNNSNPLYSIDVYFKIGYGFKF